MAAATPKGHLPAISLEQERNASGVGIDRRIERRLRMCLGRLTPRESKVWLAYLRAQSSTPVANRVAEVLVPELSRGQRADVAKLIETDPILSDAVLRCANTESFFGRSGAVSVRAAVDRLGPDGSSALALSLSSSALYNRDIKATMESVGYDYEAQWVRGLTVACVSRKLAVTLRHPDPDAVYTVALFHQIGRALAIYAIGAAARGDAVLSALSPRGRRAIVDRLAPAMTLEYLRSNPISGRLADLILDVDAAPHAPVSAAALVIRLALGLIPDRAMSAGQRGEVTERARSVAVTMELDLDTVDVIADVIDTTRLDVSSFVSSLARPSRRRSSHDSLRVNETRARMTGSGSFAVASAQSSYHPECAYAGANG